MESADIQFGQMAIARGAVSVSQLIRSVGDASLQKKELRDVLIKQGLITNSDAEDILNLIGEGVDALKRELELGKTIVLEAIGDSILGFQDAETERFLRDLELESHHGRYEILRPLGKGGMGEVFEVLDHALCRNVALKRLREDCESEKHRRRLLLEAQVTGLLEHPSIVPIYDIRNDESGNPFYIMRVVQEKSLEGVLKEVGRGESQLSLVQLVSVLRQVSLAVHYAHDKGVIHRDLKPENILLGKYGEVYVIDWGIAKILHEKMGLETTESPSEGLIGTPRYMSPEQARGESGLSDARSDVYALGAILYEILTLCPVFESEQILALLFKVVYDSPTPPCERAADRKIPKILETITLKALEKDPEKRFQSALAFADELEVFLDGVKEAERKKELALIAFEHATQVEATYVDVQKQQALLESQIVELKKETRRGDVDSNEKMWEMEQQFEDFSIEIEYLFGETIKHYSQVLVHEADMGEAIERIGALYWTRFRDAEREGDKATAVYFEGLVRQFNDGRYDELLEGSAFLNIENLPSDRKVILKAYHLVKRRLEAWEVLQIEVSELTISHGSYLLEITGEGYAPVRIPFVIDRGEKKSIRIPDVLASSIPDNFIYIHEGEFRPSSSSREVEYVGSFAIQKYPVTVEEYLEFINDIDPNEADAYLPKSGSSNYFEAKNGKYLLPAADEEGDAWDLKWPILSVNYLDAVRYTKWKSESTGLRFRIPTLAEWLKSARGADGRVYPWGSVFNAGYCRMRDTTESRSVPSVVGLHSYDRSPYGVHDLAGNIAEWTSTFEKGTKRRFLAGASYNTFKEFCELDFAMSSEEEYKFAHYGIRVILEV